jgi:type III restriction enzyme
MSFELLDFQEEAVETLRLAIAQWTQKVTELDAGPSTVDREPIPLLAHLTAITGAGKTPILAKVIGSLGPAIVLWTTNRSVVIDQTVEKLSTTYRHFLPANTTITGETPSGDAWTSVMEDEEGVSIICTTVAKWNAPDDTAKGTVGARLTFHRTAPDRTGDRPPWTQLGDVDARKRMLWVVYDEGHGQTDVQLDQLLELNPVGMLAASGTPSFSPKTDRLREALLDSEVWGPIEKLAQVEIPTYKVARAGLLKAQIELNDQNTDPETKIVAAVTQMRDLDSEAAMNGLAVSPRAIYIVEESNSAAGEARPVAIWRVLTERCGVPTDQIAVATKTRELPKDAERVWDLSQLRSRHRHLIFNKVFSEGWDDPQAYIAYFDGETKSATRIKQNIGRVIRQPNARHFDGVPDLNTAFIYLSTADEKFGSIVESIRKHLVEEYGSSENGEANVKVRRSSERPAAVPLRAGISDVSLPILTIAAGNLDPLLATLKEEGERVFSDAARDAPGEMRKRTFKLTDIEKSITAQVKVMGQHIRSLNRDYFLDRVKAISREAFERLPEATLAGPMFEQDSATLSPAQARLAQLAREYIDGFEGLVTYVQEPDPKRDTWRPRALEPSQPASLLFTRSLHARYPDVPSFLNGDEKDFAHALDQAGEGWWMRNPPVRGMGGYGIPLSAQVAGSQTFFPDFLWWIDNGCLAIDTTGVHILPPKVRGKLLNLPNPKIALVTRGRVSAELDTVQDKSGWTLLRPGAGGPRRTHHADLGELLKTVREA